MSLIGKKAIVTGGSRGLGLNIAKKLSKLGCNVALLARSEDVMRKEALPQLTTKFDGQKHNCYKVDLSDRNELSQLHQLSVFKEKIDILINCAGITHNKLLIQTDPDEIDNIITTNLTSSIVLSKLVARKMLSQKSGHIISISSALAKKPISGTVVYTATKQALIGLTKSLAVELGGKGIQCNAVLPGFLKDTLIGQSVNESLFKELLTNGHKLQLDDISDAVVFLLNDKTMTGQCLTLDKGFSLI